MLSVVTGSWGFYDRRVPPTASAASGALYRDGIIRLAARFRLPALYSDPVFASNIFLTSATSLMARRAARTHHYEATQATEAPAEAARHATALSRGVDESTPALLGERAWHRTCNLPPRILSACALRWELRNRYANDTRTLQLNKFSDRTCFDRPFSDGGA